jgi:hypothetical protein
MRLVIDGGRKIEVNQLLDGKIIIPVLVNSEQSGILTLNLKTESEIAKILKSEKRIGIHELKERIGSDSFEDAMRTLEKRNLLKITDDTVEYVI